MFVLPNELFTLLAIVQIDQHIMQFLLQFLLLLPDQLFLAEVLVTAPSAIICLAGRVAVVHIFLGVLLLVILFIIILRLRLLSVIVSLYHLLQKFIFAQLLLLFRIYQGVYFESG